MKTELCPRTFRAVGFVAATFLTACTPALETSDSERDSREGVSRPPDRLEDRYAWVADAQEAYEGCMERLHPGYLAYLERNGHEPVLDGLDGSPVSPALEGCANERRESERRFRVLYGEE